jgi:DNA repair protein RecO (recombination protein O)
MPSEKTEGIIVRLVNWSETSCILTLLTKDFGLISAVAKGARRPNGPFESALDLLAHCRILFIPKSSDALDILTEAKLVRRFKSASSNLVRLNAGFYLAELTHSLLEPGQPFLELFELLAHSLCLLDQDQPIGPIVLQYELQLLRLLGHLPSFEDCACCAAKLETLPTQAFAIMAGGVVCPACQPGQRMVIRMQHESLACMHSLAFPGWKERDLSELNSSLRGEIRGCIQRYLSATFDRRFRLHDFLEDLAH